MGTFRKCFLALRKNHTGRDSLKRVSFNSLDIALVPVVPGTVAAILQLGWAPAEDKASLMRLAERMMGRLNDRKNYP